MAVILPCIVVWLFLSSYQESIKKASVSVLILILGVVGVITPIFLRNYIYEKDIVPITALAGLNLYIGNAQGADGRFRSVEEISSNPEDMIRSSIIKAEEQEGRSLKPSEVSSYWTKSTLRSVKKQGFSSLARLYTHKVVLLLNGYELPDIWDYYFIRQFIPILGAPLVSFYLILPLCLAGIFLMFTSKYNKNYALLLVYIIAYAASLIFVFITSRYRVTIVPLMAIASSFVFAEWRKIFDNRKIFIIMIIIAVGGIYLVNIPIRQISFETSYNSLGIVLKTSGDYKNAELMYNKALEIAPRYPNPYYNLALLYRDKGDKSRAIANLEKAIAIDPDFVVAKKELVRLKRE